MKSNSMMKKAILALAGLLPAINPAHAAWELNMPVGVSTISGKTYDLHATPVTQGYESVATAYMDKYRPDYPEIVGGFPSPEEAAGLISVFRLNRS